MSDYYGGASIQILDIIRAGEIHFPQIPEINFLGYDYVDVYG